MTCEVLTRSVQRRVPKVYNQKIYCVRTTMHILTLVFPSHHGGQDWRVLRGGATARLSGLSGTIQGNAIG